jgi:2',3'-cyclic-nucleotide 2'-phosphodiesterase (5'-nucleotidase family)
MDFDYIGIAKRIIAEYRQEVDVLVLVSHLGLTDDIAVAEQTNGIDLILGGHSHNSAELSTGTEGDGDGGEKGPVATRHGPHPSPCQATKKFRPQYPCYS